MFPVSGAVGGGGGGGTVTPPPPVVVPDGITETGIQSWIRGNGLFRPVFNVMEDINTSDKHWQCILSTLYITFPAPVTINVIPPTSALGDAMDPYAVPDPTLFAVAKPAGAYMYIVNPNNTNTITVNFPAPALVTGYNGTSYQTTNSWNLPQGRMMLVFFLGNVSFYVQLL